MNYKQQAQKLIEEYIAEHPIDASEEDFGGMTIRKYLLLSKDVNGTIFDISGEATAYMYNYRPETYTSPLEYTLGDYDISAEVIVLNEDGDELDCFELEFKY
jgi:hypothetical protein